MSNEQIFSILDQATQPGVKLNRIDYINIQRALEELSKILSSLDASKQFEQDKEKELTE
jgi:hypothetical protein